MVPCYQICSDRKCRYWDWELLDCERLPDGCEYAVEHLLRDDYELRNQSINLLRHGYWVQYTLFDLYCFLWDAYYVHEEVSKWLKFWYLSSEISEDGCYIRGKREGIWRIWHWNGKKCSEGDFKRGLRVGEHKFWDSTGELRFEGSYVNGLEEGEWHVLNYEGKDVICNFEKGVLRDGSLLSNV